MAFRAYFSFDYEDVGDFRADSVRAHKFVGDVEKAGFFDSTSWAVAKKREPAALKKQIDDALEGTFATAVLFGDLTYSRRWVRYEILKSVERGNALLGINVNGIAGKDKRTKPSGPNPLNYVGLLISADGNRGTPTEWDSTKWVVYRDLGEFPISQQPADVRNKNFQLSFWYKTHDWVANDGSQNFYSWIT
jgi:hypothetical protein